MKKRFILNLQLFAGEQSVTVDDTTFEIEDDESIEGQILESDDGGIVIADEEEDASEGDELQEDGDNGAADDQQEQYEEVKPDNKGKNDKANAVIAERRKWQERVKQLEKQAEIAQKVMKAAGVDDLDKFQKQLDAIEAKRYTDKGLDPQTAQMLVTQQRQIEQMQRDVQRQKFDVEAETLKKDAFYADIDDWRDEIEPIAVRTGLTLEQAYMAFRGAERKKEFERIQEQRMIANRSKKASARVDTSATGGAAKKGIKVQLTPDELAIAKLAGISPEAYYKQKKK